MYKKHYGLSEGPFDSEPDLKFVYLNPDNKEHLSSLVAGIQERKGFVVVTGEPGVGKSVLVETALSSMPEDTKVARVLGSVASFDETLAVVLFNLGLMKPDEALSQPEALKRLADAATDLFAENVYVVIFIKEAQDLDLHFLKNLRHLFELEVRGQKLVRIILCGQPELEDKLLIPEMLWTRGRKIHTFNLKPLTYEETDEYIKHRLSVADYQGVDLFKPEAVERIWEYAAGVPQKINTLCRHALLIGHTRRKRTIEADIVEEAIEVVDGSLISETLKSETPAVFDLPSPPGEGKKSSLVRPLLAVLLALVCVSLALFFYDLSPKRSEKKAFVRSAIIRPLVQRNLSGFVDSGGRNLQGGAARSDDNQEPPLSIERKQKDLSGSVSSDDLIREKEKPAEIPPAPKPKDVGTDLKQEKEEALDGGKKRSIASVAQEEKSVPPAPPPTSTQIAKKKVSSGTVVIQVAAFRDKSQAQDLMARLRDAGFKNPYVEKAEIKGKGSFYRVRLGGFNNLSETQAEIAKLNKLGYGNLYIKDMTQKE
jgi:type II secretory pathway predicted ATPase ExeA